MILFPPFEPDKSIYTTGTDAIYNVYPRADGWGAVPSLVEVSDALVGEPLGGIYGADTAGNFFTFVGTSTGIFKFTPGTGAWADVSRSGGYDVKPGARWQCIRWGDYLVFTAPSDTGTGQPPQYYNLNSSSAFEDIPNADFEARYVIGSGDFVVFANTGDTISGQTTVRWSGLNDITFHTPGQNLCDVTTMPQGGEIMGLVPFGVDGFLVVQRNAMRPFDRAPGNPYVFVKGAANEARGAVAPYSIVTFGANAYAYWSQDGFHVGLEGSAIGAERVNKWVGDRINPDAVSDITGTLDPFEKIIWWRFDGGSGEKNLIGWSYQLDRWCSVNMDTVLLLPGAMPAETLDSLAAKYADLDSIPFPLGSRVFQGGSPVFGAFTSDWKLGFLAGAPLAARVTTALSPLAGPGARTFVRGVRLIGDVPSDGWTVRPKGQDFHGGAVTLGGASTPHPATGSAPLRFSSRITAFQIDIDEGVLWKLVAAVDLDATQEGRR